MVTSPRLLSPLRIHKTTIEPCVGCLKTKAGWEEQKVRILISLAHSEHALPPSQLRAKGLKALSGRSRNLGAFWRAAFSGYVPRTRPSAEGSFLTDAVFWSCTQWAAPGRRDLSQRPSLRGHPCLGTQFWTEVLPCPFIKPPLEVCPSLYPCGAHPDLLSSPLTYSQRPTPRRAINYLQYQW